MIELKNVWKTIGRNSVLCGIDLVINKGEVVGISGINGSGKTMLMRVLLGLIKPTQGSVSIDGKTLWQDISFPESVGFLIENPAFIDSYSGFKNLEMIASIKAIVNQEQIISALNRVGLDPDDKRKYRKYSLGMKQRLGIAASIMESPDILILDEPTNALDAAGVDLLETIVLEERKRGCTIVLSCHDRDVLNRLSDVVYRMEAGKIRGKTAKNEEEDVIC